jgi:hypothetical protein
LVQQNLQVWSPSGLIQAAFLLRVRSSLTFRSHLGLSTAWLAGPLVASAAHMAHDKRNRHGGVAYQDVGLVRP